METVKASSLIGQKMTLIVNRTPCAVRMDGSDILTKTTTGILSRFIEVPAGAIGILVADDGRTIAFDAYNDLRNGAIEIELEALPDSSPTITEQKG